MWKQAAMWGALCAGLPCSATAVERVSHGRFEEVPIHRPDGPVQRVVMWFTSAPAAAGQQRVEALRRDGALVIDVDAAKVAKAVAADGDSCGFSSGDVENFSRFVQAYAQVPTYQLPIIGGDAAGAGLAYAITAQSDAQLVAGLVTEGFCPTLAYPAMMCGTGVDQRRLLATPLAVPWLNAAHTAGASCSADAVQAVTQHVPLARTFKRTVAGSALPGERAAIKVLGAQRGIRLPPVPGDLAGLPLVEVPATPGRVGSGTMAIFLSGDGGWAGLDKEVAAALAQAGVPVVGVDSLRYFWSERTPEGLAADLARIAAYYTQRWQAPRVLLIGFSQGADVLPAAVTQLSPAAQASVAQTVLLSLGKRADYEFHVSNWLGGSGQGRPIAPDLARMDPARTLCVYGQDDDDALCRGLPANSPVKRVKLAGDHHFDGDYQTLAKVILDAAKASAPASVAGAGGPVK